MRTPGPRPANRTPMSSRKLHRWIGIGAAVLFLLVSGTGVALQIQQLFGEDEVSKEATAALISPASLARPLAIDAGALDRARRAVLARFGNQPVANVE